MELPALAMESFTIADIPLMYGLVYSTGVLILSYLIKKLVFTQKKLPLPPDPKGLPMVGNVPDLPPKGGLEWQHWLKHKDLYGPISSVTVFGQTIILLHDYESAIELLDRRGAKYSSRGRMVFAGEMFVKFWPGQGREGEKANSIIKVWI